MDLFMTELTGSIVQLALFSLIPVIWWLATEKGKTSIFEWLGFKAPSDEPKMVYMSLAAMLSFVLLGVGLLFLLKETETALDVFKYGGLSVLPAILVYGIIHTALTEEIFFRGFLLKRLADKFGFVKANIIQAVIFGLVHGIALFGVIDFGLALGVTVFTGAIGWVMGYINEQTADGSIFPSWIIHATANVTAAVLIAFELVSYF